jgi:hypothetical protein
MCTKQDKGAEKTKPGLLFMLVSKGYISFASFIASILELEDVPAHELFRYCRACCGRFIYTLHAAAVLCMVVISTCSL